ncbi:MAG: selenium cofactor biosynthesis protein YqeC [Ruminococcus flavefaciens]|nr:selenium cofactor biosynthesis protein YqeC [Ruminococcus flavefaciens]
MKKTTKGGRPAVELAELLEIRPGVTAVVGGGGKTALLRTLGGELARRGRRVLLCTTTKIFPFPGLVNLVCPSEPALRAALERHCLVCAGTPVPGTGKLTALKLPMFRLAAMADFVLVEADGAAGRPMKAHASHEPVIPPEAGETVAVVGASGFGRPIQEAAHRPAVYAALAGLPEGASVTPAAEAAVLRAENLHDRVYINQVETEPAWAYAAALAGLLDCPAAAGSLQRGAYIPCSQ